MAVCVDLSKVQSGKMRNQSHFSAQKLPIKWERRRKRPRSNVHVHNRLCPKLGAKPPPPFPCLALLGWFSLISLALGYNVEHGNARRDNLWDHNVTYTPMNHSPSTSEPPSLAPTMDESTRAPGATPSPSIFTLEPTVDIDINVTSDQIQGNIILEPSRAPTLAAEGTLEPSSIFTQTPTDDGTLEPTSLSTVDGTDVNATTARNQQNVTFAPSLSPTLAKEGTLEPSIFTTTQNPTDATLEPTFSSTAETLVPTLLKADPDVSNAPSVATDTTTHSPEVSAGHDATPVPTFLEDTLDPATGNPSKYSPATPIPSPVPTLVDREDPTAVPDLSTPVPTLLKNAQPTLWPSPVPTSFDPEDPTPWPSPLPTSFDAEDPTPWPSPLPTFFDPEDPSLRPSPLPISLDPEDPTPWPSPLPTMVDPGSPTIGQGPPFQPLGTITPTEVDRQDPTPPPISEATPAPSPDPSPAPVEQTPEPVTPNPSPAPSPAPVDATSPPVSTDAPTEEPSPRPSPAPVTPPPSPEPSPGATPPPSPQPSPSPTDRPSTAPTAISTDRPTPNPSPAPTTTSPTNRPTPDPSPSPTDRPSPLPTLRPTPFPTTPPVPDPTPNPTLRPTRIPTVRPTQEPTVPPTRIPTLRPTPESTTPPTRIPTLRPTSEPSSTPTLLSTPAPVSATSPPLAPSTDEPTSVPTQRPTRPPTARPTPTSTPITDAPSRTPTQNPTRPPTPRPTSAPSSQPSTSTPSLVPSDTPSQNPASTSMPTMSLVPSPGPSVSLTPSSEPSLVASLTPTFIPSMAPSASYMPSINGVQKLHQSGYMMDLTGVQPMSADSIAVWSDTTAAQIEMETRSVLGDRLERVEVKALFQKQEPPLVETSRSANIFYSMGRMPDPPLRRRLQSKLTVDFDVTMLLKPEVSDPEIDRYVGGAFNSVDDQDFYLTMLRESGDPAFENVESVAVRVPANGTPSPVQPAPPAPSNSGNNAANIGIVTGLVVAGVSSVLLAGFFLYSRRKRAKSNEPPLTQIQTSGGGGHNEYASEIDLDIPADVSTLGEPMIMAGAPADMGDASVDSSLSPMDYDFQRTYFKNPDGVYDMGSESSGIDTSNIVVAKDDDTLDAQYFSEDKFEVDVPAGMLGLVLTSGPDGVPTVHAIKESSPLASSVEVGDRLLSVDEVDVRAMLASDVSRLIAARKENRNRHFVFTRPSGAGGSDDRLDGASTPDVSTASGDEAESDEGSANDDIASY